MRASNKQLTILSEAEKAALYESPDFDDEQRLSFLNLTPEEQALVRNRANLSAQVHFELQIGYFKSMHMFFPIHWDEVQEDTDFIMQEYFPEHMFSIQRPSPSINIMRNATQLPRILFTSYGQKNSSRYCVKKPKKSSTGMSVHNLLSSNC